MNFENKKTSSNNLDDMNIKTHLNASLDLSGICVSEELIQKTLQAVKEQPAKDPEKEDSTEHRKAVPWKRYVRSLTGVAAAVLILFAGYYLVGNGLGSPKKMAQKQSADTAPEESAKNDMSAYDTAESYPESAANTKDQAELKMEPTTKEGQDIRSKSTDKEAEQGIKSKSADQKAEQDMGSGAGDGKEMQKFSLGKAPEDQADNRDDVSIAQNSAGQEAVRFHVLCSLTSEQTGSITITNELSQTSLTLTEQADINGFYSFLDQYFYCSSEESSSEDLHYTIEMDGNVSSDVSYRIRIGTAVTVEEISGETNHTSTYSLPDQEEFLGELSAYLDQY